MLLFLVVTNNFLLVAKSAPVDVLSREPLVSIDTQTSPTLGFMGESAFTKCHRQLSEMQDEITMETPVIRAAEPEEEDIFEEAWAEVTDYHPAEEYDS